MLHNFFYRCWSMQLILFSSYDKWWSKEMEKDGSVSSSTVFLLFQYFFNGTYIVIVWLKLVICLLWRILSLYIFWIDDVLYRVSIKVLSPFSHQLTMRNGTAIIINEISKSSKMAMLYSLRSLTAPADSELWS